MVASPAFAGDRFRNEALTQTLQREGDSTFARYLLGGVDRVPSTPLPTVPFEPSKQCHELSLTWLGHSTLLIELEGFNPSMLLWG